MSLVDLDFVDDIRPLSSRFIDIREKIQDLHQEGGKMALKIKTRKSKDLNLNNIIEHSFIVEGEELE